MAHKVIDNHVVVDWTTGDLEGDRVTLLAAYRDFIKEVRRMAFDRDGNMQAGGDILAIFDKWQIDTENQIDDVPRIWIKRPE